MMSDTFAILKKEISLEKGETENSFCAHVVLPEDFPPFDGHFPDRKILPGVAQLTLVAETVRLYLARETELTQVKRIKFMNPAMPLDKLCISIDLTPGTDSSVEVKARISKGDTVISTMSLSFICKSSGQQDL